MSFIYDDKKLIEELIKSAVNHDFRFNKQGQGLGTDPNLNMEWKNYLTLTQKLVDNIKNSVSPKAQDTGVISAKGDANLGVPEMNSLGNFLEALATNAVTVGGNQIVYFAGQDPPNHKNWLPVDAEQSKLLIETMDEQGNRKAPEGSFYVNPTLLSTYINSLSASMSKEQDAQQKTFMKTMLDSLIGKINSVFRTKLTSDYKEPEKQIDPTEVLTTFPASLDYKRYSEDGPRRLTWGDIQSADALKGWVGRNNIGVVIEGRQGGPLAVNHPEFDFCVVVRVIYAKATWLARSRPDPDKKIANFVKKISEVGPTLQGPDGKACTLTASQGDQKNQNQQGQQGGAASAAQTQQMLHDVVQYMPLRAENFDFTRVEAFFEAYERLLLGTQSPQLSYVQQAKGTVHTARQEISSNLLRDSGMINFPMSGGASTVVQWLQAPQYENYLPFVQKMLAALEATKNAISMFYSAYVDPASNANRVGLTAEERGIVSGQFMGDSYYQRNRWAMNKWLNTSGEVTGLKR